MKKIFLFITLSLGVVMSVLSQTTPKNIIIFVANGVGYNHIKALELYNGSTLDVQSFPVKYGVTTYPGYSESIVLPKLAQYYNGDYHNRRVWTEFAYADSMNVDPATVGTAIGTGIKSAYKAVGVDLDSSSLETILERAHVLGKSTGIITDLPLSKSGVASFAAHNPTIDNSNEIFSQLLASNLSLMIGCGNPNYTNNEDLQTTPDYTYILKNDWDTLTMGDTILHNGSILSDITNDGIADSWTLLQLITDFTTTHPQRLLGIPQTFDALRFKYNSAVPEANVLSLSALSEIGLNHLTQNSNGFVIVVETGAVDYFSTLQNKEGTIDALTEFKNTYQAIDSWIQSNSTYDETLFIVTGGYETGYLSGVDFDPLERGPNYMTESIKVTNGATGEIPEMQFNGTTPTNHVVPMFAKGTGSELFSNYIDEDDFVYGPYINNTEIGQVCFRLMPIPLQPIQTPKNIILMINDGAGLNQIRAAQYFSGNVQSYRNFPVSLYHSTYPLITDEQSSDVTFWNNSYESNLAWLDKNYLRGRNNGTCSGASGTAIASGKKTYYYSLGVDKDRNSLNSIARYAKSMGKSIGVAANIPHSDATPAVFIANNVTRNNAGEISRQMIIESTCDLIIGGGHPEYDKHGVLKTTPNYTSFGGVEFWQDFIAESSIYRTPSNSSWTEVQDIDNDGTPDPWTVIQDSSEFAALMTGPTPKRLFGIAKVENSPQYYRNGINVQEVHTNDLNRNMPELWQIARVSLNMLNKNPNGFFVMIEGDAGDNAGHSNYKGRLIEEQMRFDVAVDSVIAWIEQNGGWTENLLIVTSDHETGLLCHPDLNTDSLMVTHYDIVDNGVGQIPGMAFYATHHSNQLVPIFAKGAGTDIINSYADNQDYKRGKYLNNSEIGQAMFQIWGGEACTYINYKPTIIGTIPNVSIILGVDTSFTILNNFVEDFEDTELQFKVTTRPAWLTFNPATLTFSGTPTALGNFNVKVVVTDGATTGAGISVETIFIVSVLPSTDIKNIELSEVTTYPNPAVTNLIISVPESKGEISLYSISGNLIEQRIITKSIEEFDVSNLSAGTYSIEIKTQGNIIKKIIVIK